MKRLFIASLTLTTALVGCTIEYGDHLVTGNKRSPIPYEFVKIYTNPPAKFEQIGIVSARGSNAFASSQNRLDHAIIKLKKEAAKIGANGVILTNVGDQAAGSISNGFSNSTANATAYGTNNSVNVYGNEFTTKTSATTAIYDKAASGIAIYTKE